MSLRVNGVRRALAAIMVLGGLLLVQPIPASAEKPVALQSQMIDVQGALDNCSAIEVAAWGGDLLGILATDSAGEAPYSLARNCPIGFRESLGYCIPLTATSCGGGRYCSDGGHCCGTGCCPMQSSCIIQNGVYGCRRL